jgi:hypothetical protein
MTRFAVGRRRSFVWRGWFIDVALFGNLWVAEYSSSDGTSRSGSMSWHRGASPADVAGDLMRELRSVV